MAFNPYAYPSYYQYSPYMDQRGNNQQSGVVWVQGETGAKAYPVAPNTTVQLWDSEAQVIYLKSADASGMPSMKIIDYTIRDTAQNKMKSIDMSGYVTREELEARLAEITKKGGEENGKSSL